MKIVRFENPALSFNPSVLFIEKQDDAKYKIFYNGYEGGVMIERGADWFITLDNVPLTESDKTFLIMLAKSL